VFISFFFFAENQTEVPQVSFADLICSRFTDKLAINQ